MFSIELSERKAYTSALVGMRTADILPLVQPGQPLYPLSMGRLRGDFVRWAVECRSPAKVRWLPEVGVSGGTVEQDVAIVEAAIRET